MSSAWSFLTQPLITAQKNAGMSVDVAFDTDVRSSDWDGGASLSGGVDDNATTGYLIDFETGAAQFMGSMYIGGNLELTSDGVFKTGASGETRVEIAGVSGTFASVTANYYAYNVTSLNVLRDVVSTSGVSTRTRKWSFNPGTDTSFFQVSRDDTNELSVAASSIGTMILTVAKDGLAARPGSDSLPGFRFLTDLATGVSLPSTGTLALITAGTQRIAMNATRVDIRNVDFLTLPYKTTTGDPSSPTNGDMYVNKVDRVLRVYSGNVWRTAASW